MSLSSATLNMVSGIICNYAADINVGTTAAATTAAAEPVNIAANTQIAEVVEEAFKKAKQRSDIIERQRSEILEKLTASQVNSIAKEWSIGNETLRFAFSNMRSYFPDAFSLLTRGLTKPPSINDLEHIKYTRAFLGEGIARLPKKAIVVVCGAQIYNNEMVEQLDKILPICRKLILIDYDENTLKLLSNKLKSKKVVIVKFDLSGNCVEDFAALKTELAVNKYDNDGFIKAVAKFLNKLNAKIKDHRIQLKDICPAVEKADFVVSSLVGTQLSGQLAPRIKALFAERNLEFHDHIEVAKQQQTFCLTMLTKHAMDLYSWTAPKGQLYFADTTIDFIIANTHNEINPHSLPIIYDELQRCAQQSTVKNWYWIFQPYKFYKVRAIMINVLKPNEKPNFPDINVSLMPKKELIELFLSY